jgi:cell division protein FtsW
VTNTIPNTGITLPFVSYGGTSVLFLLSEMGLAFSVAGNRKSCAAYANGKKPAGE